MMPTLIRIPPELFGLPVFGVGWLLGLWLVLVVAVAVWQVRRHGWTNEMWESLPLVLIVGAAIVWFLPQLAEYGPKGEPLGVAIRGFGVMMLCAILAGVGLSAYRAKQIGLDPDVIPGLAFWMIACGIVGARLFFVIQYWDQFAEPTIQATLFKSLNATQGGLVVYGSVIGGLAAAIVYLRMHHLPLFVVADAIAPGMILGQAIGRIGCFMNGCCYGGLCTLPLVATPFPAGSPAYSRQAELGELRGIEISAEPRPGTNVPKVILARIFPGTPAAEAAQKSGVKEGDEIRQINGIDILNMKDGNQAIDPFSGAKRILHGSGPEVEIVTADKKTLDWTIGGLPRWSLPIHPTQIYSFLDAGLLCLFLWFYYPYRRHEGEVFALLMILHPISRFLLEMLRADEGGQFGTSLTISQWLSIAFVLAGVALLAYLERFGKKAPGQGSTRSAEV